MAAGVRPRRSRRRAASDGRQRAADDRGDGCVPHARAHRGCRDRARCGGRRLVSWWFRPCSSGRSGGRGSGAAGAALALAPLPPGRRAVHRPVVAAGCAVGAAAGRRRSLRRRRPLAGGLLDPSGVLPGTPVRSSMRGCRWTGHGRRRGHRWRPRTDDARGVPDPGVRRSCSARCVRDPRRVRFTSCTTVRRHPVSSPVTALAGSMCADGLGGVCGGVAGARCWEELTSSASIHPYAAKDHR